ncbi:glycoside hydrolase family 28 protein [Poseidonocella sedimentorum]|uniref:Polygalacturonase n=1 Tax=Poseidonocella sedimentorum TaxID=871652 RepID=A0A1I6EP82_9RHOB|nr:glycoside hydrolase family 28 protein [Poseidonocella sedimentorum]SFR19593.1 Polygalacturonase [Poseidonocella sedimentorum]
MAPLRVLATSARTLSLLVTPPGTRYHLPRPIGWSLEEVGGGPVAQGTLKTAALFLGGLEPDRAYRLRCDLGTLDLRTAPCAGMIDAAEFGADPARADNAPALQEAIAATPLGGTLRLGPGRFESRPIFLKSAMTLLLDGAELAAVAGREDWPILPARDAAGRPLGSWEGLPEPCFAALVTAQDAHDLTITGRGIIDGGGDRGDWWSWPKETRQGARRPRTLHLAYCDRASISGVTIRNSPSWTVHPYRCRDLTVAALRIENPPESPNTDGLNPESCEDVRIEGVAISVGDDCIAIKAGKRAPGQTDHLAPTRGLTIANCLMERGHGAVVLGSEMSGGIHDVTIRACDFDRTDRGIRLKTRRGRGGEISNLKVEDVVMRGVPTPLAVNAFYFCDPDGKDGWVQSRAPAPVDDTTPRIRDISLRRIEARGVEIAAAALLGLPEAPVTGIEISDFRVSFAEGAKAAAPLMTLGCPEMRHAAVWAEFAEITGALTPAPPQEEDLTPC